MSDEHRNNDDKRPSGRRGSVRLTAIITAVIAIGLYVLIILQHI